VDLPFEPETETERRIVADPQWREGAAWGTPRPGHAEGAVVNHIAEVLDNIDEAGATGDDRTRLRLIALVHDVMKHRQKRWLPPRGENHHARRGRRFAERHVDDPAVLDVVELHDDAYHAWLAGDRRGRWDEAERRGRALLERLGDRTPLYLAFYRADNATDSKTPEPLHWFERLAGDGRAGPG
jgi:hypothetical protein